MSPKAQTAASTDRLVVYWQPGCTSCLRLKEFLKRNNVEFESVNVLADAAGLADLVQLAGRRVPILRRGSHWVDGQVLGEVARLAGIPWGKPTMLSPQQLVERIQVVLQTAERLTRQIPDERLAAPLRGTDRTYRHLVTHILEIVEIFLDLVEHRKRFEVDVFTRPLPAHSRSTASFADFNRTLRSRLQSWWSTEGAQLDFTARADVYYGVQSMHDFLERTAWHAAQHTRQLALVVEDLGLTPQEPLGVAELAGLPLPENAWENVDAR